MTMRALSRAGRSLPLLTSRFLTSRRHIDLLRTSSAVCPSL
ncbi:putative leader peptide [Streptomyces sp. ISL-12]